MVGTMRVPSFLDSNTGNFWLDVMPCFTLVMCVPMVKLFYDSRRYYDTAVAIVGWSLALLFHACHMHEGGLQAAVLFGVAGPTWRTLDVLVCQYLLVRTVRDAVGSRQSRILSALPNIILPGTLAAFFFIMPSVSMKLVSKTTFATAVLTVFIKLAIDGFRNFPSYTVDGTARIASAILLAFLCFVMPIKMPEMYWFWHSMWHIFLGIGYYMLYTQLGLRFKAEVDAYGISPEKIKCA